MSTTDKVKTGLDECRMLALGAQVLIGFQFQGAFQARFADLTPLSKQAHIAGVLLLITALGLLIVPSTQHLIVEEMQATRRIQTIVTRCLDLSLLFLGGAFSLDVAIAVGAAVGLGWALACGLIVFAGTVALWFAWPLRVRSRTGKTQRMTAGQRKSEEPSLSKKIDQMLTEARTVLPGAQALLGFQLTVCFSETFAGLSTSLKTAHLTALLLVAVTIMLLMTPAAYHRIVYLGEDSSDILRVGTRTITLATIPLAAALAIDTYVTCVHTLGRPIVALCIGSLVFCALLTAWISYPMLAKKRSARR
jgi:hypothetical protein